MNILNGNTITIRFANAMLEDRVTITNLSNVSMEIDNDLRDITTRPTNSWSERISGVKSSTMSFDGILDTVEHFDHVETAIAGTEVHVIFGRTARGWSGSGFISSIALTGGTDTSATISASITITGERDRFVSLMNDPLLDNTGDPILDNTGDDIIARIPTS